MPKSASDKRHFIIVAGLVVISTVALFYILKVALPLPAQGSTEAITIDGLIDWHLALIAFLFSLVVVIMIYAFVVFRKRDGDESEGEHFEGNTTLEIVWTVAPLIFVVVFSFYGINALAEVTHSEPNEVEVTAVGQQWSWLFEYPNGIISPELVLPVDKRAHLTLHSNDVLHSFWIPEMRVKQDLVPMAEGQPDTEIRFTPVLIGDFKVRCAELCGRNHYSMETPARILSQEDYDKWVDAQLAALNGTSTVSNTAPISGTATISGTTLITNTAPVTTTVSVSGTTVVSTTTVVTQ